MMASVLSVLLLLSTTLPLVLQVCCDDQMSQPVEPPCHDSMAGDMQDVHDEALQKHIGHSATGLQDDCCVIQSAQTPASLVLAQPPVLQPMLLAATSLSQPARTEAPSLVLAEASPVVPSLSLHILHGSFLN
jgi:hypothetical protein